ncbi:MULTISPECIES: TrkH family potassium uptake protein [Bacillus cereus group]|uniref:Potassium transporter TrkH n=1 Tax=Bacillus cereus TaxID=1396 RepID=A0ABD4LJC0_BACCE|nr:MULTISPECIES: TrkH family potassium uptake protein [Bacillus cereus group]MRD07111.1 potassium transporter TrkH [Bacillus thuringiensis]MBK1610510.1 potassium transporter TrkH [Bacillus cereus]MBR9694010.1 potassium transporter TrkH [Bacillus cereus]MDA1671930.1 TrkH family potassium uptake protein [Bacillus cereus]MEC0077114.1 TrkH family potassium uptake protein [Bacillus anthracis]
MKRINIRMSPPRVLTLSFIMLSIIGTCLLKLPIATTTSISWLDALFTTVSACTVTGLGVVDTGKVFTLFGQCVILTLIQVGGLGIMSFAVLIAIMLGKKIGLQNRILLQQALNQTNIGGVIRLAKALFLFSFTVECIATLILSFEWIPKYGIAKGLYYSFFHSISAFNNAGFSVWSDNLMSHSHSILVNLVISSLIILGGIGFTVIVDIKKKKNFKNLTLHSKLMLSSTLIVNIIATVFIFIFEFHNSLSMRGFTPFEEGMAAYFQAVSTRTAGFNTVDISALSKPSLLLMMLLMFIGAGSASTGGGIKLTTFLIMFFGVFKFLQEQDDIVVFKKSIKDTLIVKSLTIAIISISFIFFAILILSITERVPLLMSAFEVFSAFGTVGLSMNFTPHLTMIGKAIIIFMMFFGKMGPLTLAFSFARKKNRKIKYPNEDILTG